MAAQENATLAQQFYDLYNKRDFDRAVDLCDENIEWINVTFGETFRGLEGCRQFMAGWANGFPDSTVDIQKLHGGEDAVVCEAVFRGAHTGPLVGPAGEIQPTGRTVGVPFCQVHEVQEGKFVGCRLYFDAVTFMSQLGLMPTPAQA
jgi:steroid delta-isomerase-like uncharacterized protein